MKGGRPPKPTAIRKLAGNPSGRAYNLDEPQLPAAADDFDEVPEPLALDPVAAREWARLAPLLREARVVTEADRNALVAACQQWSIYQDALVRAPAERRVIKSPNDYPMPNPYLAIANKALTHCERLWEALGLTPSARSRVVAARAPSESDPFAEFDEPRMPKVRSGPTLRGRAYADTKPN